MTRDKIIAESQALVKMYTKTGPTEFIVKKLLMHNAALIQECQEMDFWERRYHEIAHIIAPDAEMHRDVVEAAKNHTTVEQD